MTSVMSLFSCTLPFPRYYLISDPTQSSVTSVMSMFNFTFLSYDPISDLTQSSVTSVILMSRLKSSMTSVMSMFSFIPTLLVNFKFPISHIIRDIRDVNDQLHPNLSPLWSNFPSLQWVAESWHMNIQFPIPVGRGIIMTLDIKFPISAERRRIMTLTRNFNIKVFDHRSESQDHTV